MQYCFPPCVMDACAFKRVSLASSTSVWSRFRMKSFKFAVSCLFLPWPTWFCTLFKFSWAFQYWIIGFCACCTNDFSVCVYPHALTFASSTLLSHLLAHLGRGSLASLCCCQCGTIIRTHLNPGTRYSRSHLPRHNIPARSHCCLCPDNPCTRSGSSPLCCCTHGSNQQSRKLELIILQRSPFFCGICKLRAAANT